MIKRFKSVFEELNLKNSTRSVLLFPVFFLVRRIMVAYAVVYLESFISQMVVWLVQTLLAFAVLHNGNVLQSATQRRLETMNEAIMLALLNLILCFTDWMEDEYMKYQIGFVVILLTCSQIVISIAVILYSNLVELKTKCRQIRHARS